MRLLLASLLMSSVIAHAAECSARSGPQTAALVELYTSEGCSSCPPADRWLSQLGPSPVPIAFHVAYWDYLGWKDVYGDARYTERQRQFAQVAGARSVYTPQVVLAGRDFPEWRSGGAERALEAVTARPARAHIEIVAGQGAPAIVKASLAKGTRADDLALFVALTESGLKTHVKGGENRGEMLRHDHVARELRAARAWGAGGEIATSAAFKLQPGWNPERMRVVAFVQSLRTGEVLQALSAPFCPGA